MKKFQLATNIITYLILGLPVYFAILGIRWINNNLSGTIPDMNYQTIFPKDTFNIKKPDTEIKWLERIKQVEAKPETVKVVKYVYDTPKELVNFIKADGKNIRIRTQKCGSTFGKEIVYPYYKYFQFVPEDEPSMIYYRDYWDWDRLNISVQYDLNQQYEIKIYTSLQFNMWALKIEPYISNKSTGIGISKRFW